MEFIVRRRLSVFIKHTINSFKNKLDKFWANENVKLYWTADLNGYGSYS